MLGTREITYKGEIDLVTEVGRDVETLVTEELLRSFPGHGVLAEEGTLVKGASG